MKTSYVKTLLLAFLPLCLFLASCSDLPNNPEDIIDDYEFSISEIDIKPGEITGATSETPMLFENPQVRRDNHDFTNFILSLGLDSGNLSQIEASLKMHEIKIQEILQNLENDMAGKVSKANAMCDYTVNKLNSGLITMLELNNTLANINLAARREYKKLCINAEYDIYDARRLWMVTVKGYMNSEQGAKWEEYTKKHSSVFLGEIR